MEGGSEGGGELDGWDRGEEIQCQVDQSRAFDSFDTFTSLV